MKQLVCEMCGGTDIVKQDGLFVCQSCGMKYSAEDAKKMMIEGTVEVQGTVQVKNAVQLENLLQLAHSSYDSKNYAQAEEFCNQVIAMDGTNYDAWKLKGEAINYQITGTNDRITEVYNCIMTSYKVLDEDSKDEHREEILSSLRVCLEGEIDFALDLFKANRPTNEMLAKVKNTFVRCASNVITSYKELGYSNEDAENYKTFIKNYYVKKVNKLCADSWDNQVHYNYYRGGWNKEFYPTRDIMKQYLNEGSNLVALLEDSAGYFSDETPAADKRENYRLRNFFARKLVDATSFKLMEHTTTNGYGAVINRYTQWEIDTQLTSEAKASWNKIINTTCKLFDDAEIEMAKSDPATQARMVEDWKRQRDSTSTAFKLNGSWTFATLFLLVVALCGFFWGDNIIDGFGTTFGIILLIIDVIFVGVTYVKSKEDLDARLDKVARLNRKIDEIRSNKPAQAKVSSSTAPTVPQAAEDGKWVCSNCGTQNKNEYGQCKKCGQFRK